MTQLAELFIIVSLLNSAVIKVIKVSYNNKICGVWPYKTLQWKSKIEVTLLILDQPSGFVSITFKGHSVSNLMA